MSSKLVQGMFVLALAACGGDNKAEPPKADPTPVAKPAAPTPTPDPTPTPTEPVADPAPTEGSGSAGSAAAAAAPDGRRDSGKVQMIDRRQLLQDAKQKLEARKRKAAATPE